MKSALILLVLCVLSGGCASYYRVTDPVSGRAYYTTKVDDKGSGSVRFEDAATGSEVTLQNSSVQKITEQEYESNRGSSGKKM